MNDSAFCHSSTAQCPIPYTPREFSREVKMVIEEGEESHRYSWQPHRCQKATAAWLPRQGGREAFPIEGRGLWTSTFLPHSLLLLPIANGKAKASPGCLQKRVRLEAGWVIWCIHLQDCLLGGDSSCVFAKVGFKFLFRWAKWWVNLWAWADLVVWWCSEPAYCLSLCSAARRAQYIRRHVFVRPEAWPQGIPEFLFAFSLCPSQTLPFGLANSNHRL